MSPDPRAPGDPAGDPIATPADLDARIDDATFERWRQARADGVLPRLAERLRSAGLNPRAVGHVCGVRHPLSAPIRLQERLQERRQESRQQPGPTPSPPAPIPPAALMVHLWILGAHLNTPAVAARLGGDLDTLLALDLVHLRGDRISATVCMIPLADAMVVSDRADLHTGRDTALVADDSALHTLCAVPPRAHQAPLRWLDIGTGSAAVPLARPGSATAIVGTDINPRALAMAELGAALGGIEHLSLVHADLWPAHAPDEPFHRVTFNAPIPDGAHAPDEAARARDMPWYRYGTSDILARFWERVPRHVTPDAEVVVHSVVPADQSPPWLAGLEGEVMVVRYTPPGMVPAFAMTAWRPGRPTRYFIKQILLDPTHPHVTRAMLELP